MPFNYYRTKRPHEALLDLYIDENIAIVEYRRERLRTSGIPPFAIVESNSLIWIDKEDRVWLLVCLGQAPAKE